MKRLTFKAEHVPAILNRTKTATARWKCQMLYAGDIVSAVTGKPGKPAFLTPAAEGFATVKITSEQAIAFGDLTDEICAKTGADREWYKRENPLANDSSTIYVYEFEVLDEGKYVGGGVWRL